jgi:chromosome segregation ATPase
MGRIGVSYEEVATAAQEAQGKGKSPTVDNIRHIIGSGSKSTIARHLRDWRNQQGIARGSDGAIPSELLGLVKGLWERLRDTVEQKGYEYQSESDEKVKEIQQQLTQSQQQYTFLQEQHHQLEEKWYQQTKAITELQSTLAFEQQEKAKITERAASQELHRQEQQNEIERLHQLLTHVQNNLEHYQTTTQQLRQEQSLNMEKQRNEYEQRISQLQQQIASITAEKSFYQAQYKQTHQVLEKLQSTHEALTQAAQEIQTKYHVLFQEHAKFTQQYQDQSHDYEIKKQLAIQLQIKISAYQDRITSLEKALEKAEGKIQILRDDFTFVSQEKANFEGQINQLQKLISTKQIAECIR